MERGKLKSFSGQIQAMVETDNDFAQKLKQRLISESSKVANPFEFIVKLFNEGVLSDGSNDLEAYFGFKEMIVQLAVTIGCSKGADGIGGLVRALESSGNLELLSALRTWAKEDFGIETDDGGLNEPKGGASAVQSPPTKRMRKHVTSSTEIRPSGSKLIDNVMPHVEEGGFMEKLEGQSVGKASHIVNAMESWATSVHQNIPEETGIELTTGLEVDGGQSPENAWRAACSMRANVSPILDFSFVTNEQIIAECLKWTEPLNDTDGA